MFKTDQQFPHTLETLLSVATGFIYQYTTQFVTEKRSKLIFLVKKKPNALNIYKRNRKKCKMSTRCKSFSTGLSPNKSLIMMNFSESTIIRLDYGKIAYDQVLIGHLKLIDLEVLH